MRFMNDLDIECAVYRYTRASKPNRLALALVVRNLADWADSASDGWHSWPKPCRAAAQAMALLEGDGTNAWYDRAVREDITDAEMLAAVRPIKAFLTRCGPMVTAEEREIILRAVDQQPI
jgi:hypothetical protein